MSDIIHRCRWHTQPYLLVERRRFEGEVARLDAVLFPLDAVRMALTNVEPAASPRRKCSLLLAMQKVVGSSPIIRSRSLPG
jgi:hypothetical protein